MGVTRSAGTESAQGEALGHSSAASLVPEREREREPTLRELMRSDVDRYSYMLELDGTAAVRWEPRVLQTLRAVLMCQGLKASLVYRVGHALAVWAPQDLPTKMLRLALRLGHWLVNRGVEAGTGISINEHAVIGRGLYIAHFGGIIVGAVRIGDHCNLSQNVTLGRSGRKGDTGRPDLGDRVWIGPGAVIAGDVSIGDDAVVGANSVVTRTVPARSSALGAPPAIRPGRASFEMVVYRSSHADEARRRSVALLATEHAAG